MEDSRKTVDSRKAAREFTVGLLFAKSFAPEEDADTFFPNLDKLPGWEVERTSETVEENGVTYRFVDYINTRL